MVDESTAGCLVDESTAGGLVDVLVEVRESAGEVVDAPCESLYTPYGMSSFARL